MRNKKLITGAVVFLVVIILGLGVFYANSGIEKGEELKIGFVTDIEYSQNRKIGSKFTNSALIQLAEVCAQYNNQFHPDLIVAGGDYVRVGKDEKTNFLKLFSKVKDGFRKMSAPKIFMTGGAEEKVFSREEIKNVLKIKHRYNSKKIKGVRILTLDMKGFKNKDESAVGGKINKEELEWLKEELDKDNPTIIFSHFSPVAIPLEDGWRDDFESEKELVELIQESDNVLAVISGNSPVNYAQKNYKVPYLSVASLVQEGLLGNNLKLKVSFEEGEYKLEANFSNGEWARITQNKGERRSSKLKTSKVTKYDLSQEEWKFLDKDNSLQGRISNLAGTESNLVSASENRIYVAYQDEEHDNAAHIKYFDGHNWDDVGKLGDFAKGILSAEKGGDPNMVANDDELFVAFMDKKNNKRAKVLKWDLGWKPLADKSNANGFVSRTLGHEPVLTFDENKKDLYIAFSTDGEKDDDECDHSCRIRVKRWNGSVWQRVGGEYISKDIASEVDIVSSKKDSSVYIAYQNHSDKGRIHVKKWNGVNWTDLTDNFHRSNSATDIAGFSPSIALDDDENLYLVYTGLDFNKTYITRWNGVNWEKVGNGMVSTGRTAESTIAIEGNKIIVAFSQLRKDAKIEVEEDNTDEISYKKGDYWRLRVVKWHAGKWQNLPSKNFPQGFISIGNGKADPSAIINEGKLMISFTDAKNKNATRIIYYDLNTLNSRTWLRTLE